MLIAIIIIVAFILIFEIVNTMFLDSISDSIYLLDKELCSYKNENRNMLIELEKQISQNHVYMQDIMRAVIDVEKKFEEVNINKNAEISEDSENVTISMPKNIMNEWFNGQSEVKSGEK